MAAVPFTLQKELKPGAFKAFLRVAQPRSGRGGVRWGLLPGGPDPDRGAALIPTAAQL